MSLQQLPAVSLPVEGAGPGPSERGAGNVAVTVAKSFDDPLLDAAHWDRAVASLGGSVYMSWDWLRTWWEYYGRGSELRLIVCSAGSEVVGAIPVYIQAIGLGPFKLRVARLVGANIPPKVFDPPVAGEWGLACFQALVGQLIGSDGCDVISLGPLSDTCDAWRSLPQELSHEGRKLALECDRSEVHTVFVLPESQTAYLASLSKNEQKQRRKYELRMLRKEHDVTVDVISGPTETLLREFDEFAALHAAQWNAEGKSGHFGAWPDGLEYNRGLVKALGPLGRVRFVRIQAGGKTVSNQYIFAFGGRWYWELPARSPAAQWDRYSLGPSGIVTMIGEAIGAGVHWIQGGLAHYDYKLRLGAQEHAAPRYRIYRLDLPARVRLALFNCGRWVLRLCYHKIWYRRIMPRVPVRFRRSQWGLWLRWDF